MIQDETITGGMIPKINTCLDAINNGVTAVGIIDGEEKNIQCYLKYFQTKVQEL